MTLDFSHSLGEPPSGAPAFRRSMPDASEGVSDMSSLSLEPTMDSAGGRSMEQEELEAMRDKVSTANKALTKAPMLPASVEEELSKLMGEETLDDGDSLIFLLPDGKAASLEELIAMRDMTDGDLEQAKAAHEAEAAAHAGRALVDVEFALVKTFYDCAQPADTALDMALVREIAASIQSGSIKSMAELDAFLRASKPRFPEAWAWKPEGRAQERKLGLLYSETDNFVVPETWLQLKHRQEQLEWKWSVLERFFRKVAAGELASAVDQRLAADITRRMAKDKAINSVGLLEQYLDWSVARHSEAFAWKPKDRAQQEALLTHKGNHMQASGQDANVGRWLKLKIRHELCTFSSS